MVGLLASGMLVALESFKSGGSPQRPLPPDLIIRSTSSVQVNEHSNPGEAAFLTCASDHDTPRRRWPPGSQIRGEAVAYQRAAVRQELPSEEAPQLWALWRDFTKTKPQAKLMIAETHRKAMRLKRLSLPTACSMRALVR